MYRLSVKYQISALSAQKSNYRYWLKFSRLIDYYYYILDNSTKKKEEIYSYLGGKICF